MRILDGNRATLTILAALRRLPMTRNPAFIRSYQLVIRQFAGEVVQRRVSREEFCSLLLSRRTLERCDDGSSRCRGLFDLCSGEWFDIRESELHLQP